MKTKRTLDELKPLAPTATVNIKRSPTLNLIEINPHTNSQFNPASNTQYKISSFQEKSSRHAKYKKKKI